MDTFSNTKVICYISDNDIYFDCENHSGDRDVCLQASALCNMLVCECINHSIKPKQYQKGRVHLEVTRPSKEIQEVFIAAMTFFHTMAEKYPENIKVYN